MISRAYQAEGLLGSYLTAPLRASVSYDESLQKKIKESDNKWVYIALMIANHVARIFIFTPLAILGVCINLFLIPPPESNEKEYGLWARLTGVPASTEKFFEKLEPHLNILFSCSLNNAKGNCAVQISNATGSKGMTFVFNDFFKDDFENRPVMTLEDVSGQSPKVEIMGSDDNIQALRKESRSKKMKSFISDIKETLTPLSRRYGWAPSDYAAREKDGHIFITIYLPFWIALPEYFSKSTESHASASV